MSVNVLQQRTATQGYDIMGGGTPQPEEAEMDLYPTDGSPNPVTSNGIYDALLTKQDTLTFDSAPTDDSTNPVTSGGVYDALLTKQDALTFDDAPTNGSNNPVKSDGIFDALVGKVGLKKVTLAISPLDSYITVSNNYYLLVTYILEQCANNQIDPTKPLFIGIKPQVAPLVYTYMIMNLKSAESSTMYFEKSVDGVIYGADADAKYDSTKGFGLMGGAANSYVGIPVTLIIAGFTN